MYLIRIFLIFSFTIHWLIASSFAQDLMKERIRKLSTSKTSVYIDRGIFHNGAVKEEAELKSIRQSFNPKEGYERIVLDFAGSKVPKVYGHFSSNDKRLYVDLFTTNLAKEINSIGKTKFIDKINFFPIEKDHISVEFKMKTAANADVFYLENPGRIVIDFKN